MKSLYKEYFDGINANSEDDIINYLKDVKEGRYTVTFPPPPPTTTGRSNTLLCRKGS